MGRAAAAGLGVAFARIDLADPDTLFDAIAQTGGFDILVNNAGVLTDVSLLDRRSDFAEPQSNELLDTISDTAMPAPISLHNWRNGRSVTPAIGATIRLFFS